MKEIDSFNLICRLCLENPKKLLNIFDEKTDIQKKLFDLTEIQVCLIFLFQIKIN